MPGSIEKAFNTKVYVWYGNTEQCGHITECKCGKLHVQNKHSYIRILDKDDEDTKPGETGRIVATNLLNRTFPLINYNTNDFVKVAKDQTCPCGQDGLVIDYIDGRIENYIILPNGRLIGRLDHIFKRDYPVKNAQIVQNNLNEIIIVIEKKDQYSLNHEKEILREARARLGNSIDIIIDYNTRIKKEINGKFRFIVQNLKGIA